MKDVYAVLEAKTVEKRLKIAIYGLFLTIFGLKMPIIYHFLAF